MSFHGTHTPGEMIERLEGDVTALSNFFSQFFIQVLGNLVLMLGVTVLLFREDWRVGLVLGVFAALSLAVLMRLRGIAVPNWTASREAHADLFGFLEERLAGTEDIRSCGAKAYVMGRFYRLMREVMRREVKAGLMDSVMVNSSLSTSSSGRGRGPCQHPRARRSVASAATWTRQSPFCISCRS